jgi:hypothetical protein
MIRRPVILLDNAAGWLATCRPQQRTYIVSAYVTPK